MSSVDTINSSLYFSAVSSAASESARQAKKKEKTGGTSRTSLFRSALQKNEEMDELASAGLPPEIAGMDIEDAVVFLKDRVTMRGDVLSEKMTSDAFADYRVAVSQLMKFIIKHSFDIEQHKRMPDRKTRRERNPLVQIKIIDDSLNQIASAILSGQADKLKLLKKVEEIQGLIVDMLAE
jgi:uncharacterized protein